MTREELEQQYWHYYIHLEKQFMETIEYVELVEANHDTFSGSPKNLVDEQLANTDKYRDTEKMKPMKI